MSAVPSGLWWRELLRGGMTILFALLALFTFNFFITALGIYLVLDGALEMITAGRRQAKGGWLTYVGGLFGIALGMISLLNQGATLFFLVVVVSIRLILRGGRVMLDARRSPHTYEGLTWLLGIVLLLVGLLFLGNAVRSLFAQTVLFSLILIVLFMSGYALVDGVYLLVRGLLLRLKPAVFIAPEETAGSMPDLYANLPSTTRRALIFVRYAGANGFGHVGWAFEWHNGWFNAGALENEQSKAIARPQEMGLWSAHTLDPVGTAQRQYKPYDAYKMVYVTHPQPKEA